MSSWSASVLGWTLGTDQSGHSKTKLGSFLHPQSQSERQLSQHRCPLDGSWPRVSKQSNRYWRRQVCSVKIFDKRIRWTFPQRVVLFHLTDLNWRVQKYGCKGLSITPPSTQFLEITMIVKVESKWWSGVFLDSQHQLGGLPIPATGRSMRGYPWGWIHCVSVPIAGVEPSKHQLVIRQRHTWERRERMPP